MRRLLGPQTGATINSHQGAQDDEGNEDGANDEEGDIDGLCKAKREIHRFAKACTLPGQHRGGREEELSLTTAASSTFGSLLLLTSQVSTAVTEQSPYSERGGSKLIL